MREERRLDRAYFCIGIACSHLRTGAGLEKSGVGVSGVVAGSSSSVLLAALSASFSSSCTAVDVLLGAELKALIVSPL